MKSWASSLVAQLEIPCLSHNIGNIQTGTKIAGAPKLQVWKCSELAILKTIGFDPFWVPKNYLNGYQNCWSTKIASFDSLQNLRFWNPSVLVPFCVLLTTPFWGGIAEGVSHPFSSLSCGLEQASLRYTFCKTWYRTSSSDTAGGGFIAHNLFSLRHLKPIFQGKATHPKTQPPTKEIICTNNLRKLSLSLAVFCLF